MGLTRSAPVPFEPVDDTTNRPKSATWLIVAMIAALALFAGACSKSQSATEEVRSNRTGDESDGPAPTAPPLPAGSESSGGATGGDVDANELIRRIDSLNSETDLCTLLTGQALKDIATSNVNLTSLLTNPSGFTQLFSALDRLFAHLVQIGPAELTESLKAMQGVWTAMAGIDPRGADAETKAGALIGDPKVQSAQSAIGSYVQANCAIAGR